MINQVSSFSVQRVMLEILLNLFEIGCPIAYAVKANITIEINY
jgi:organic hydroperoxide reductase OsmC/OhrA